MTFESRVSGKKGPSSHSTCGTKKKTIEKLNSIANSVQVKIEKKEKRKLPRAISFLFINAFLCRSQIDCVVYVCSSTIGNALS